MDIEPRGYATFADLAGYCYRVASVVGICCLHVWGYRSEGGRAESLAEKCGLALQLTNIIRDVRGDACNGRIYLPEDDLARFGVAHTLLDAGDVAALPDAIRPETRLVLSESPDTRLSVSVTVAAMVPS